MSPRGTLHVEVRLRPPPWPFWRADEAKDEVAQWILRNFSYLKVGEIMSSDERLASASSIEYIKVDGYTGYGDESNCFPLQDTMLDIQVYRLQDGGAATSTMLLTPSDGDRSIDESESHQMRVAPLPHVDLDGLWESLAYPGNVHVRLLRLATRMLTLLHTCSMSSSSSHFISWNGLFLLHGPPGSGKTTVCRGLAQKLKIRLGNIYAHGKMIEVHPESLISKYFGESGKLIAQIFDKIQSTADSEPETLICVIIDEVESLVSPREQAMQGDVADAIRVTNAILTALDRLRRRPNVMVLCTSNLPGAIDSAFLDRVDMSQAVPNPGPDAAYSILRSSLNELIKQGIVASTAVCKSHDPFVAVGGAASSCTQAGGAGSMTENPHLFPSLGCLTLMAAEDSLAFKLWQFSKKCVGMSGRSLRRLPVKALGLYTYAERPSVGEVLEALQLAADDGG